MQVVGPKVPCFHAGSFYHMKRIIGFTAPANMAGNYGSCGGGSQRGESSQLHAGPLTSSPLTHIAELTMRNPASLQASALPELPFMVIQIPHLLSRP